MAPGWRRVLTLNACVCPGGGQGRDWPRQPAWETFSPHAPPPPGTGKVVPGTVWCQHRGCTGGGGNPALSFRLGNWSQAVPLPLARGNTIPGWVWISPFTCGVGKGVAAGSRLLCLPQRAPSAHQGGRAQAVTRGAGTGVLESGSPFPPQGAVAAGRLRGEVTATGLAATWLGQLGGCRSGEPGGPLPYPVPCPVARGASSRIWGQQPQPYLPAPGPPVGQDGGGGGGDPCPQASGGVVAGLGLAPKRFRLIRASWPVDPWLLPAPRWRPPHRPGDPCTPRPSQPRLLPT